MNLWCAIIKRKEIIIWIRVYPNWKTNFKSKTGRKRSFSYETKATIHLSQWVEWIYGAQSLKEGGLLCEFVFIPIERRALILKRVEREVFLWNQSINSFIPISGMCLRFLIMKTMEIFTWIHVSHNWKMNFQCKSGRKRSFSFETKVSIHLS